LTRRCVDLTIANSRTGAEFNSRVFGQPIGDYRVVYNGVDMTRFLPRGREAMRRQLGIPAGSPVIGVFASFKPQKNHAMLLGAFRKVLERVPDARLLLVGGRLHDNTNSTTDYQGKLEGLINELRIRERCVFLGNRDDVEQIYPACDVTVLSSLYEGTPNVLLESMACGVPVVATDVSDNSYVVRHGETGFIVPLDDASGMAGCLRQLLEDDALRQKMGQSALAWVGQEFTIGQLVTRTGSIYLQALATKRKV
jgi:glycosyltransferase involved in cell wall biosynthesis